MRSSCVWITSTCKTAFGTTSSKPFPPTTSCCFPRCPLAKPCLSAAPPNSTAASIKPKERGPWRRPNLRAPPLADTKREVHVVFAKAPVVLEERCCTHAELGGQAMGHAPFTVVAHVPFLSKAPRLALTSVHLPPSSRAAHRDVQARALLSHYPPAVRAALGLPFSLQGARDARAPPVAHVLCGDFNADLDTLEALGATPDRGWRVGLAVPTSAGGKPYDNFVFNDAALKLFALGFDVLAPTQFQNSAKGEFGVSDHAAVVMRLKET